MNRRFSQGVTFELIAKEWLDLQRHRFAAATFVKAEWTFNELVNPYIGSRPISEITAPELLAVFRKLEGRRRHETAHRTKQRCGQVFRFAIATGRATRDPTADLRGALAPVATKNHPAITEPTKIGELLRAIHGYNGMPPTAAALRLAPLVFVRPGELRKAEWSEFNLDAQEWRIPAARMKMRQQHIVPLAHQSVKILRELHPVTSRGRYVFPSPRNADRPMSENAITAALRRMGYTVDEMTWHGFRTIASTSLNELGWNPDLIELQLLFAVDQPPSRQSKPLQRFRFRDASEMLAKARLVSELSELLSFRGSVLREVTNQLAGTTRELELAARQIPKVTVSTLQADLARLESASARRDRREAARGGNWFTL